MTCLAFLRNRLRPQRQAAATLIYLHVPKTAGQSLLNAAAWQYRPVHTYFVDATDPIGGIAAFRALPHTTRDGYRFIGGHTYYGMHRLLQRPAVYAARLRWNGSLMLSIYWSGCRNALTNPCCFWPKAPAGDSPSTCGATQRPLSFRCRR